MHLRKSPRALDVFISAPTKLQSGHFSFTGGFQATKSQVSLLQAKKFVPRLRERRCTSSPPSLGQNTPVGIDFVPRHFGNVEQPRNSPLRPLRTTIIAPHTWHGMSVMRGLARSPLMGRVYLQVFGWFSHARNGPKNPPRGSSLPPHSGQRTVASSERSCASAMSAGASTFPKRAANGD